MHVVFYDWFQIRKLAIQHMPDLCRSNGDNTSLSDILSQLLAVGKLYAVVLSGCATCILGM